MGRKTTLSQDYFDWLYSQIKYKKTNYTMLCKELCEKKFRWSIHNDDNRCEDGLNLRNIFIDENQLDESHTEVKYFLKAECTLFEVLVALAQRMNDVMYDLEDQDNKSATWFHEMIKNLELDKFTDLHIYKERFDPLAEAEIDDRLDTFLSRTYDFYGNGSLFPLKKRPRKDMANTEIWYQMMAWLDENYRG